MPWVERHRFNCAKWKVKIWNPDEVAMNKHFQLIYDRWMGRLARRAIWMQTRANPSKCKYLLVSEWMCKYRRQETLHRNKVESTENARRFIRQERNEIFSNSFSFLGTERQQQQRTIFAVVSSSLSICLPAIDIDKLLLLAHTSIRSSPSGALNGTKGTKSRQLDGNR